MGGDEEVCRHCGNSLTADNRVRKRLGGTLMTLSLGLAALLLGLAVHIGPAAILFSLPLFLVSALTLGYGVWLFLSRPARGGG